MEAENDDYNDYNFCDDNGNDDDYMSERQMEPYEIAVDMSIVAQAKEPVYVRYMMSADDIEHLHFLARGRSPRWLRAEFELWKVMRLMHSTPDGHNQWTFALRPTRRMDHRHNPFALVAKMHENGFNFPFPTLLWTRSPYPLSKPGPPPATAAEEEECKEYEQEQQFVGEHFVRQRWFSLLTTIPTAEETPIKTLRGAVDRLVGTLSLVLQNLHNAINGVAFFVGDDTIRAIQLRHDEWVRQLSPEGLRIIQDPTTCNIGFDMYCCTHSKIAEEKGPHWELYTFWVHLVTTWLLRQDCSLCAHVCMKTWGQRGSEEEEQARAGRVRLDEVCKLLVRGKTERALLLAMRVRHCFEGALIKLEDAERIWDLPEHHAKALCALVRARYLIGKDDNFVQAGAYSWKREFTPPADFNAVWGPSGAAAAAAAATAAGSGRIAIDVSWLGL